MKAYKLLGRHNDMLVSLCYLDFKSPGIVYEEGRANTAEFPLFVFKELSKAEWFLRTTVLFHFKSVELWEVEAVNLRPVDKISRHTYIPDVRKFWTTKDKEELDITADSPDGSYICDYLTLVRKVGGNE